MGSYSWMFYERVLDNYLKQGKTKEDLKLDLIKMKKQIDFNKQKIKNDTVKCPVCEKDFLKISKRHTFCRISCKDRFWKFFNTSKTVFGDNWLDDFLKKEKIKKILEE